MLALLAILTQVAAAPGIPAAASAAVPTPDAAEHHLPVCPKHGEPPRFYPEHASRNHIPGAATLRCRVGDDHRMHDCTVLQESPPGEHFGDAAVGLAYCAPYVKGATGERTFPIYFRPGG